MIIHLHLEQKFFFCFSIFFLVHMRNYVSGFLGGCMFSLVVALVAIVRTRNILQDERQELYMNSMFPLYR